MGRYRRIRARPFACRLRAGRSLRRRLRAAAASRQAAARVRDLRGALRLLARAGQGRHEAHARDGAALGRSLAAGRQHAPRGLHRGPGLSGQGPRRRPDARVRGGLSRSAGASRPSSARSTTTASGTASRRVIRASCSSRTRTSSSTSRTSSYQINDFGPSIRRTYIGKEHSNVYGTHSWYGDTIGFWDGNKLVSNTKYVLPADFTRWSPMTSNAFEGTEIWELKTYPGGIERLEVQVTFYDKHLLQEAGQRRLRVPARDGHGEERPSRSALGMRPDQQRVPRRQGRDELPPARRRRVQRRPRHDVVPASCRARRATRSTTRRLGNE